MKFSELPRGQWFVYEGVEYSKQSYPDKTGNATSIKMGKVEMFDGDTIVTRIPQRYLLEMEEGDTFLGVEEGDDTVYTIVKKEKK